MITSSSTHLGRWFNLQK